MNKHIIALAVSVGGCFLSTYWYKSAKEVFMRGERRGKPLAILQSGNSDIEKKPGQRLIWLPLEKGSALLNGDTIRTGSKGEGRVQLLKSRIIIELEPDSLIVIEKLKGEISLDLLSGGLFVKNKGSGKSGKSPTITAGKTKLSLGAKSSEFNLSMTDGKSASVAISKGNVSIDADGKSVNLKSGDTGIISENGMEKQQVIEILSPLANAALDIGSDGQKFIPFRWNPIDSKYSVHIETGLSRSSLLRKTKNVANGKSGLIKIRLPAGKLYWQLVATDKTTKKISMMSLVFRATTISLSPAVAVAPLNRSKFFLANKKKIFIPVSWAMPQYANKVTLYVAKDPEFKKMYFRKSFDDESEFNLSIKKTGKYYWKTSAFFRGIKTPLSSNTQEFQVSRQIKLEIPTPKRPFNKESIPLVKAKQSGLFLEWTDVPGIETYKVRLNAKNGKSKTTEMSSISQFRIENVKPGSFTWQVQSIGPNKRNSEWSDPISFKVLKTRRIAWIEPSGESFAYETNSPSVDLSWERGSKMATKWRLRFASSMSDISNKRWKVTSKTRSIIKLPQTGNYQFEVQALNKKGDVIAIASKREIEITPPPALKAPLFKGFSKNLKKANADGSITIKWERVKKAKSYLVLLTNRKSKVSKEYKKKYPILKLDSLSPGKYSISVLTINSQGLQGEFGEEKTIKVPKYSNIMAPVIDTIKVD